MPTTPEGTRTDAETQDIRRTALAEKMLILLNAIRDGSEAVVLESSSPASIYEATVQVMEELLELNWEPDGLGLAGKTISWSGLQELANREYFNRANAILNQYAGLSPTDRKSQRAKYRQDLAALARTGQKVLSFLDEDGEATLYRMTVLGLTNESARE